MNPGEERETSRRGRPRIRRKAGRRMWGRCFEPCRFKGGPVGEVILRQEELEILRLIDIEGFSQEAAAELIGVSRRTLWRDLQEIRRKCAEALIFGKKITLAGCHGNSQGRCSRAVPINPESSEEKEDRHSE